MTSEVTFDRFTARGAIEGLALGQPPVPAVAEYISVGLEDDLDVFAEEYFGPEGLLTNTESGAFKLVEAYYGGGKTHYLRAIERLAHRQGFTSAFIELHRDSCPLTRFDLVYSRVAETLTAPPDERRPAAKGLVEVIRTWVTPPASMEVDPLEYAQRCVDAMVDLPLPSMRIALRDAAFAAASQDNEILDELHVYLRSGKISSALRKRGVLEAIDVKTGVLALRSLAVWLRAIGYPGLLLVLDEGDRSLSIVTTKETQAASNNLVQLVNETVRGEAWPGVMLLYSIPQWSDFEQTFGSNQALLQRLRHTGFPSRPPAPRIVLDDRFPTDADKIDFCVDVGRRLHDIFLLAYPDSSVRAMGPDLARRTAQAVVEEVADVSFRRLFVQGFLGVLFASRKGARLSDGDLQEIVRGKAVSVEA